MKHNLWEKLDQCSQSSSPEEHLGYQALHVDSNHCHVTDNYTDDKSIMEEYTMDTCLENCSPNEKLLESLQSLGEGKCNQEKMVIEQNEKGVGKCTAIETDQRNEQFKSPSRSEDAAEYNSLLAGIEWSPLISGSATQHITRCINENFDSFIFNSTQAQKT